MYVCVSVVGILFCVRTNLVDEVCVWLLDIFSRISQYRLVLLLRIIKENLVSFFFTFYYTVAIVDGEFAELNEVEVVLIAVEQFRLGIAEGNATFEVGTQFLLIYDALYNGKIQLTDEVVTSARAKSMGGSQVFLEEGEKQTVETLIKCIVIASGNDASVAMAEYVSGSEEAFVGEMNQKAADLGMNGTHFVDCCGLTDSNDHYTTAKDVAIMARALITNYPDISQYATIWMENITHVTAKGSSEFGLSNTNKLLKMANNFEVTGLKTGSTAKAGYCFCGTAVKDGLSLIAVVMDAPDYKIRFSEAQQLLNYGFANCSAYRDDHPPVLLPMAIKDGKTESVELMYDGQFSYVALRGENLENIHSKLQLDESLSPPFEAGTKAGRLIYYLDDTEIGEVPVVTKEGIQKAGFSDYLEKVYRNFMSICG